MNNGKIKRTISILLCSILCASLLCSCGKKEKTAEADKSTTSSAETSTTEENKDEKNEEETTSSAEKKNTSAKSEIKTYTDVLEEIKNIDLYHKPDTKGLKSEDIYDKNDDSTYTYWKNSKGETVYRYYEGYGERMFDYYTTSASGRKITVIYSDNDGKRYEVRVKCDEYETDFFDLNKNSPVGADSAGVVVYGNSQNILNERTHYDWDGSKWYTQSKYFCDSEGYKCTSTFTNGETKTEIIHTRVNSKPECKSEMLTDSLVAFSPEFVLPCYKLYYYGEPNNAQWFIETDFVLEFESTAAREEYAEKYGITSSESEGNEDDYVTLRTGKIIVPLSLGKDELKKFANINVEEEINDEYYQAVKLNGNGEITLLFGTGAYSVY